MKFNKRSKIAKLQKLLVLRERQAADRLAKVQEELTHQQERANEMCRYVVEYRERYAASLKTGVRASR